MIDIKVRDASSLLLLGRETKIDDLREQLTEKIAIYKNQRIPMDALIAQISAGKEVKMATVQDIQSILREEGIVKVKFSEAQDIPSEVLIF